MSDIGPNFLDDKQCHSRARSVGVYNPMTECLRYACPVSMINKRAVGAVWSMGHTQQDKISVVYSSEMTIKLGMSNSLATSVTFFALLRSFQ
ncbi:hypothetical protein TNCV_1070541 [Trichonephila clavipes]|nr:hypothetical protein TNCV_1070541 [Trichonephila clavipes]